MQPRQFLVLSTWVLAMLNICLVGMSIGALAAAPFVLLSILLVGSILVVADQTLRVYFPETYTNCQLCAVGLVGVVRMWYARLASRARIWVAMLKFENGQGDCIPFTIARSGTSIHIAPLDEDIAEVFEVRAPVMLKFGILKAAWTGNEQDLKIVDEFHGRMLGSTWKIETSNERQLVISVLVRPEKDRCHVAFTVNKKPSSQSLEFLGGLVMPHEILRRLLRLNGDPRVRNALRD